MKKPDRLLKDEITNIIQAALWLIFGITGLWGRIAGLFKPYPHFDPARVRKILVLRLDLLGDVILSMPAVEALHDRFPDAEIWMMTLPYTADIPRQYPYVHEVVALDTNGIRSIRGLLKPSTLKLWLGTILYLRRQNFDLSVSLFGLMASIWSFLSGATHRLGYQKEAYPLLHTRTLRGLRYDHRQHEVLWCLNLVALAGASIEDRYLHLDVDPAARLSAERLLAKHGADGSTRLVAIHAGSTNGRAKRWPAAHWAELADRLQEEQSVRIVLTGSKSEQPIAAEVTRRMRTAPIALTGQTSINELAAVLSKCDVVLSGDSGPLHMAVALNKPTVSMYGPTDPGISGPWPRPNQTAVVLRTGIGCSPCYNALATADCPYGNVACMHHLTADRAYQAVVAVLDEGTHEPDIAHAQGS